VTTSAKDTVGRRRFIKGAAAGAAALVAQPSIAGAQQPSSEAPPVRPAAAPPSPAQVSRETAPPPQVSSRFIESPQSDYMVDVIRALGIQYVAANPGSSFEGLHESLINHGEDQPPEFITCLHEESSVAMAHGYAKASGKPMLALLHGVIGIQHAAMAIYNAYCDRVPVYIMAGNTLDATLRRPCVEWAHSVQDAAAMVRDFIKWDDLPISLPHFAESAVRAYKIAMTPPMMPVLLVLDGGLQEDPIAAEISARLRVPRLTRASAPQGDSGAVAEAARLLVAAQNPVIVADRAARTPAGVGLLVQLAELLQARVIDQGGRMNFPKTHYLSSPPTAVGGADVIIGMELSDFWAVVNAYTDNGENGGIGTNRTRIKPETKLISISSVELNTKANYQDFQRFQVVDVPMAADAEATLPALIEAVKAAIPNDRKAAIEKRGEAARKAYAESRERTRQAAALGWDASPISTARLVMETFAQIKDLDWSLVASEGNVSNWPIRLWPMEKYHHWIGRSGGYGVGYGAPASVGAGLANRDLGRFSVSIQSDGDLMYAPGVLWTAAKHRIPLLAVMHNNRGYHQEVMHVQRLSNFRNRVANLGGDLGPVGTSIQNPDIEYHKLAESMGWWAKGPIKDPTQLASALKEAVAVVKSGQPALLNVWTQPR
jgi:acetolactate synthase-1/2/3 large subunit